MAMFSNIELSFSFSLYLSDLTFRVLQADAFFFKNKTVVIRRYKRADTHTHTETHAKQVTNSDSSPTNK